jgi:hypothetical protein
MVLQRKRLWAVAALVVGVGAAGANVPPVDPLGQILIVPLPPAIPADDALALPIVNDGFANDQDVKGPIRPLVAALRSPQFAEREDANQALLRLPPARLQDVIEALADETDAEAIERLTQVAAHLYLKPRTMLRTKTSLLGVWFPEPSLSMLGIKFKMDPVKIKPEAASPTMTVMVTEIQVGFPVLQTLRNGDRIVAIGGVGFPPDVPPDDSNYFRTRVAALWPGGVVPMAVLRDGRLMELDVQITGLPIDGPATPTAMVNRRIAALDAFLKTLKTGDKSQVRAISLPALEGWLELPAEYRESPLLSGDEIIGPAGSAND